MKIQLNSVTIIAIHATSRSACPHFISYANMPIIKSK